MSLPASMIGKWASAVWLTALQRIMRDGDHVKPRGMLTLEVPGNVVRVHMKYPVVLCPARKLSYRFLAGEALWILDGSNQVADIAPHNPNIAQFSDDGVTFFGAYGPKIVEQREYVVRKLLEDVDTRQAVITIWRENPPKTKDVPCTIALAFSIRNSMLHCHAFMRSSDAWLGLPYDTFNFSMVALRIACEYNARVTGSFVPPVELGYLRITTVSGHIYERNFTGVAECLEEASAPAGEPVPSEPLLRGDWGFFERSLRYCRDNQKETFAHWRIRP
jgi:thymidylate synthase